MEWLAMQLFLRKTKAVLAFLFIRSLLTALALLGTKQNKN